MPLTLTMTDNANNTGALAQITGSDASTLNTVNVVSTLLMQLGPQTWAAAGTRRGDGSINLNLTAGYYFSYASGTVAGAPAISPPVYFTASLANQAIYQQIRTAVQAKIQTLNLPGNPQTRLPAITPDRVFLQMVTTEFRIQYPCVVIADEDEQESVVNATNLREDIEYPLRVFIMHREPRTYDQDFPTFLLWRERIMGAFRYQRLLGAPLVWTCKVQPLLVIDANMREKYQHVVSGMTFRFLARQPRGGA